MAAAASMAIILAALSVFVYVRLDAELMRAVDLGLRARAGAIASGIGQQGVNFSETPYAGTETVAQILSPGGQVEDSTGPATPLVPVGTLRGVHGPTFLKLPSGSGLGAVRAFVLPANEGQRLFVVVGSSLAGLHQTLARLRLLLGTAGPAALALASLAAWFLTGAALRPVERMRKEAASISESEPSRRLPVPDADDEVARLGRTLNSLLDRLQEALSRERRLLDDASHELRTPLGILKAELDLALSRSRTADELESALRSASEETDRLARLAEDLLVLSRAQSGRLGIHRVDATLAGLLERACTAHQARFESVGVRIQCQAPPEGVRVDPMRVRQALDNLLDNAWRFSPPGGTVLVRGNVAGDLVRIFVQNPGSGFSPEVLPRAFEPFIRDDRAHQRGAGLGLAIVRAVAEAHGGTATAENMPAGGARVTMTLAHVAARVPGATVAGP